MSKSGSDDDRYAGLPPAVREAADIAERQSDVTEPMRGVSRDDDRMAARMRDRGIPVDDAFVDSEGHLVRVPHGSLGPLLDHVAMQARGGALWRGVWIGFAATVGSLAVGWCIAWLLS